MRIAYQKSKLSDAQYLIGDYFNIAINSYSLTPEKAYKKFLVSRYSQLIQKGNTSVILGKTGYELFYDVMNETSQTKFEMKRMKLSVNTKEEWAGWILVYLQWSTARSFDNIYEILPFDKVIKMYYPYHEMDERNFVEDVTKKYFLKETNLRRVRKRNNLTQRDLALKAQVSIRTIQMLEQRQNDINQTKSINLFNIAKALSCTMENLLE